MRWTAIDITFRKNTFWIRNELAIGTGVEKVDLGGDFANDEKKKVPNEKCLGDRFFQHRCFFTHDLVSLFRQSKCNDKNLSL